MASSGALIEPNTLWWGLLALMLLAIFYFYKTMTEPKKKDEIPANEKQGEEVNVVGA